MFDLVTRLTELSRDLRRNPGGSDDYPWAHMRGVADRLDQIVREADTASPAPLRAALRVIIGRTHASPGLGSVSAQEICEIASTALLHSHDPSSTAPVDKAALRTAEARIALAVRLIEYADALEKIAPDLARDLHEAEAAVTLLTGEPHV